MIITSNGPQNIGQIKRHFEHGNLFLSPDEYQTESRWNLAQKKLLIDTIFCGLDIPKFYLWKIDYETLIGGYPDGETKEHYKKILDVKRKENDDPNPFIYEVVDGQQRTRTILEYMGVKPPNNSVYRGDLIEPYQALPETPLAKGKFFIQLNADQQTRFEEKVLTVMVLEKATIAEIREMFLRLQNGTPLNSQQKRNAMGSAIGKVARGLSDLPFFKISAPFDNSSSAHILSSSQMLNLEIKGRIVSCTSPQLDKLYSQYKTVSIDPAVLSKAKKTITILGKVFPEKTPNLNRSYALSLYWIFSKIMESYSIPDSEFPIIKENFLKMDTDRLLAKNRDYKVKPDDDVYSDLSVAMSSGTDAMEAISNRHDIITQYVFTAVKLNPLPSLDPKRNFTYEEKLILYRKSNGVCELEFAGIKCGRKVEFDFAVIDHIKPHSKEGKTELDNGRIAFHTCNISRGNRDNFNPQEMCKFLEENEVINTELGEGAN